MNLKQKIIYFIVTKTKRVVHLIKKVLSIIQKLNLVKLIINQPDILVLCVGNNRY